MSDVATFNPIALIILLLAISLLPFVVIMLTSFVKLVVVFNLVRNALGLQQVPPNMVINGIALILTVFIMYPVMKQTYSAFETIPPDERVITNTPAIWNEVKSPLEGFLKHQTNPEYVSFFIKMANITWPREESKNVSKDDLIVIIPAFTLSELTTAFQIGFLLFLPFVIVDLVISNILMAMGMMMVSPMTISLPFKLLLFVLVDGWPVLIQGLLLGYR